MNAVLVASVSEEFCKRFNNLRERKLKINKCIDDFNWDKKTFRAKRYELFHDIRVRYELENVKGDIGVDWNKKQVLIGKKVIVSNLDDGFTVRHFKLDELVKKLKLSSEFIDEEKDYCEAMHQSLWADVCDFYNIDRITDMYFDFGNKWIVLSEAKSSVFEDLVKFAKKFFRQ